MRRYVSERCKSAYLALSAALACLGMAAAQSIAPDEMHVQSFSYVPPPLVALRTQVQLVEVPVVVREGRQRTVGGLTKGDFEIYDNGKKQAITAFSVQNFTPPGAPAAAGAAANSAGPRSEPTPRFVALCLDDLHTGAVALKAAKDAAERFVKTSLAPGDQLVVVATSQSARSEFTGDATKLFEQIAKVTTHQKDNVGVCPAMQPNEAYLIVNDLDPQLLQQKIRECSACLHTACPKEQVTALAEAVWQPALFSSRNTLGVIGELVDGMAKLPGQRIILLASAELLTGEVETEIDRLMAKALHAEVVINTLDAKRLTVTAQEEKNDGMAALAAGTGGSFYHNSNDLLEGFRELGMAPETMYILGFAPSDEAADGRFHSLKVRLAAGKRYSLQARLGYAAASAKAAAPDAPPSKLDSEAIGSDTVADLPVWFTWEQRAGPPNITMVVHLDVSRLHFETRNDRRAQKLNIVAVLLDSGGSFVMGQRVEFDLNLTDATFAQLAKTNFSAVMTLKAPPGNYGVRAVAQDAQEGKLTAASDVFQVK